MPVSDSAVLPRPLDPSAEELDPPLDPDELDEEDEDELPLDEPPNRLVAAVNRADAFGAELDELLLEEPELDELEEEPLGGAEVLTAPEESRPRSPRLPIRRGVMSDA